MKTDGGVGAIPRIAVEQAGEVAVRVFFPLLVTLLLLDQIAVADSAEELHAMAKNIGLQRSWFHKDHYDVCMSMRAQAVAAGAKEITTREMVHVRRRWRHLYGLDTRMVDALAEMEDEMGGGG